VVRRFLTDVRTDVEVDSQPEDTDSEPTEVDYDPMVDGYQSNTLDSLGVTQAMREAYADRTDIHPYFTRENIYYVYLEDDGDVHINVRIPGLRETIDVDTNLSEEDLNENGQDPNATIDVDKSKVDEVTEPPKRKNKKKKLWQKMMGCFGV